MKSNLNYFQHHTNTFWNRKMIRLLRKYEGNGYLVYNYLKNEIFRDKGYYMEYDDELPADLSTFFPFIEEPLALEIINYCAKIGLFDYEIFTKYKILTSKSIQEDFIEIMKRMKRKISPLKNEINLLDDNDEVPKCEIKSKIDNLNKSTPFKDTKIEFDKLLEIFIIEKHSSRNEINKFLNHYKKSGWVDKNSNPIKDIYAAAHNWKLIENYKPFIPIDIYPQMQKTWNIYKNAVGFENAKRLLTMKPFKKDNKLTFLCSKEDYLKCEENIDILQSAIRNGFGNNIKLEYAVNETIQNN